jgi:hypothetical protein
MWQIRLTVAVINVLLLLITYRMVRRHKLKASYALIWLSASACMVLVTMIPGAMQLLSRITGLYYITAIQLLSFVFLLLLLLHFSTVLSKLVYQNRQLAERVAFLEEKIDGAGKSDIDQPQS